MKIRESIRAVLLNGNHELLLFEYSFPGTSRPGKQDEGRLWITPGGAVEKGETDEAALKRELKEETGIDVAAVGPLVWVRDVELAERGVPFLSRERFYLIRLTDNPVISLDRLSPWERDNCHGYRWFSLDELLNERVSFRPPKMGLYLREILAGRVPPEPLKIE